MKRAYIIIIVLVVLSPLFGVIGAEIVGYREPLEVAAEKVGLEESEPLWSGVLPDYTFPGANDAVGYIIAGFIGVAILLSPLIIVGRRRK